MSKYQISEFFLNEALNQLQHAIENELFEHGDLEYQYGNILLAGSDYHINQFIIKAYLALSGESWFDQYGNLVRDIPQLCIAECSHAGACDADVERWQKILGFNVPRQMAINYLAEFGAWSRSELNEKLTVDISQIVLWSACCDIRESGEWFGLYF